MNKNLDKLEDSIIQELFETRKRSQKELDDVATNIKERLGKTSEIDHS